MAAVVGLLALALAACDKAKPAAPQPDTKKIAENYNPNRISNERTDFDGDNLLSLARGASVVSRTAEFSFQHSAVQAIDGEWPTVWMSPATAPEQTLVFSLAARSRIHRIGVTPGVQAMKQLRFESSLDAITWAPVATIDVRIGAVPQLHDVKPFEALYLRLTPLATGQRYASMGSVHAIGAEVAPPHLQTAHGCWTVNAEPARLIRRGAYVAGTIGPLVVEGGTDGRATKLMWRRGAQFGYMLLTITPDGRGLSAMQWHEEVGHDVSGDGWIGTRNADCAASAIEVDLVRQRLMERRNRWNLYGLAFDASDNLDPVASAVMLDRVAAVIAAAPSLRFRLVAHEFRFAPDQNRARAKKRLDAVAAALRSRGVATDRLALVNAADTFDGRATTTVTQKLMIGSVDLEVNR